MEGEDIGSLDVDVIDTAGKADSVNFVEMKQIEVISRSTILDHENNSDCSAVNLINSHVLEMTL